MSTNNIVYSGDVTITTVRKKFHLHNTGGESLFRLLTTILCREVYSVDELPTYIMMFARESSDVLSTPNFMTTDASSCSELADYVPVIAYTEKDGNDVHSSVFTASFVATNIRGGASSHSLALVSGDRKNIIAAVDMNENVVGALNQGQQSIVKWKMKIYNDTSGGTSNA